MSKTHARHYFWFAGLWAAGVLSVTTIGLIVRLFLAP